MWHFSLAPICSINQYFITVGTTALYYMMKDCTLICKKLKEKDFRSLAGENFKNVSRLIIWHQRNIHSAILSRLVVSVPAFISNRNNHFLIILFVSNREKC
jgi:hypothetical protein